LRGAVAIGDQVLELGRCAGLLDGREAAAAEAASWSTLNAPMALPPTGQRCAGAFSLCCAKDLRRGLGSRHCWCRGPRFR